MSANKWIGAVFISMTLTLRAQDPLPPSPPFDASVRKSLIEQDPKWTVSLGQKPSNPTLGKSDFIVSGPLVDTFRLSPRSREERTLGQKILDLPIINMFVPGPMPKPTRQGKYFMWGERDVAWTVQADRPIPGPQCVLLSVSH